MRSLLLAGCMAALAGCATSSKSPPPSSSAASSSAAQSTPPSSQGKTELRVTPTLSKPEDVYANSGIAITLDDYNPPKQGPQVRNDPPKGSTADFAGLRAGDLLVSLDGKAVGSRCDLKVILANKLPRQSVSIEIVRNNQRFGRSIVLEPLEEIKGCN
jgi:S1-C subfamily serine protease